MNPLRADTLLALAELADGDGLAYRGEIFRAMRWIRGCTCATVQRESEDAVVASPDPNQPRAVEGAAND